MYEKYKNPILYNAVLKTLTFIIAILFTSGTISQSAPQFCLRQQSASERAVFEKSNPTEVPASINVPVPFNKASYDALKLEKAFMEALSNFDNLTKASELAQSVVQEIRDIYENQSQEFVIMQLGRRLGIVRMFRRQFGDGRISLVRAPGRVNLIGEHTDNQDGYVLPTALDKDIIIAFRPTDDGSVVLQNMDPDISDIDLTTFNANKIPVIFETGFSGERVEKAPQEIRGKTFTYIMGSAKGLRQFVGHDIKGAQMLIDGRVEYGGIPQKAGISSSSALTVASAIALASANGVNIGPVQLSELTCDWERYQTGGGMMDQFTSLNSKKGHAIFLDCRRVANPPTPEDAFDFGALPLPKGYKLVAMNTGIKASQAEEVKEEENKYNERRTCVEIGTRWLQFLFKTRFGKTEEERDRIKKKIQRIRDLTVGNLKEFGITEKDIQDTLRSLPEVATKDDIRNSDYGKSDSKYLENIFGERKTNLPYRIRQRCLYQRAENMRVLAAREALENGDVDAFAKAINEGQTNDEDGGAKMGIEISCPELDLITALALKCGAKSARLSGKGWGGVAVALIPPEVNVNDFIAKIQLEKDRDIFVCSTSKGAGVERYQTAAQRLVELTNDWRHWKDNEPEILKLAHQLWRPRPIRPVIGAAGKGTRAIKDGIPVKVVAPIDGKPTINYVLDKILALPKLSPQIKIEKPIIIVSPDSIEEVKKALMGYDVEYIVQKEVLGTGHAVLQLKRVLKDFEGDTLVMWSTHPAIRTETLLESIIVHQAVGNAAMTVPTAVFGLDKHKADRKTPYAPLIRDEDGYAVDILESHLEGKKVPAVAEDNIGAFIVRNQDLFPALRQAHRRLFDRKTKRYRPPGELGFPNQMVRTLVQRQGKLVLGLALADTREQQGIKESPDLKILSRYINELDAEARVKAHPITSSLRAITETLSAI